MLKTPEWKLSAEQKELVYEPAEDTFLLLDALEAQRDALRSQSPSLCLDLGTGSGVGGVFLLQLLHSLHLPPAVCLAADSNPAAVAVARETAVLNGVADRFLPLAADLLCALRGRLDVVLFNPPYVPSPSDELRSGDPLLRALSGGIHGREVTERFLVQVPQLLAPSGVVYLVAVDANRPSELLSFQPALTGHIILSRRAGIEHLHVLKLVKKD